jgi:sugar phosphate isomerase/epimerase
MNRAVDRRCFLKTTTAIGAGLALGLPGLAVAGPTKAGPGAAKLGWRLGCAAYSFNQLSLAETLEKVVALGLDEIEGFTWQRLSPAKPKVQTNPAMSADDRKELKQRLADANVKMVSCYCQALDKEDVCRKTFEFAKELGIGILVAEPPFEAYDMIEKFCDQYQINLAVHNHPEPSKYWNPDTLLGLVKGRSPRIGACADTGHWVRSGLNPAEVLKRFEGRLISLHLKDMSAFGRKEAECVPWGTGKGAIPAILQELRRQHFQGLFAIEYEPYTPKSFDNIVQCIAYFNKTATELAG